MKALVGAFNQEKALVGAFSVIVIVIHRLIDLRHYSGGSIVPSIFPKLSVAHNQSREQYGGRLVGAI